MLHFWRRQYIRIMILTRIHMYVCRLYAGAEVDIWSCGVILYALLCGNLPFDDENIANLFKKIKGGVYTMPGYLSEGCRDLIPRMLVVDPLQRITVNQLRRHAWFQVSSELTGCV